MLRRLVVLALVCTIAVPLVAKDKKKGKLPRLVTDARNVFVTTMYGSTWEPESVLDARISNADRRAISDVQQALRKTGRYSIVYRPEHADILMVVRAGRRAAVTAGPRIGMDPRGGVQINPGVYAETGPGEDMLSVHDARSGPDSAALWRATRPGGLIGPNVNLVRDFLHDVDESVQKP